MGEILRLTTYAHDAGIESPMGQSNFINSVIEAIISSHRPNDFLFFSFAMLEIKTSDLKAYEEYFGDQRILLKLVELTPSLPAAGIIIQNLTTKNPTVHRALAELVKRGDVEAGKAFNALLPTNPEVLRIAAEGLNTKAELAASIALKDAAPSDTFVIQSLIHGIYSSNRNAQINCLGTLLRAHSTDPRVTGAIRVAIMDALSDTNLRSFVESSKVKKRFTYLDPYPGKVFYLALEYLRNLKTQDAHVLIKLVDLFETNPNLSYLALGVLRESALAMAPQDPVKIAIDNLKVIRRTRTERSEYTGAIARLKAALEETNKICHDFVKTI